MILILCKFSDHALNLYQVSRKYLEQSQSYGVNIIAELKNTKGNNSQNLLLFCAYYLMLLHICSKIMKISLTVPGFRTDTIFILNIP